MDFYRGDNRHPSDRILNTQGFTARPPAPTKTGPQARRFLEEETNGSTGGRKKTPLDLGMAWRLSTPGGLIATSMTQGGAYAQTDFFYKIVIPDSELTLKAVDRHWARTHDILPSAALAHAGYSLLFNTLSYDTADLIALCHGGVASKEVTFLTAIPSRYIVGFRQGAQTGQEHIPFIPFRRAYGLPRTPPVAAR